MLYLLVDSEFGSGMSTPSPVVKTEMGSDVTKTWSPVDDKGTLFSALLKNPFVIKNICLF